MDGDRGRMKGESSPEEAMEVFITEEDGSLVISDCLRLSSDN